MTGTLLLFTGGVESTLLLHRLVQEGLPFTVLELDHAARPRKERQAAARILDHYDVKNRLRAEAPTRPVEEGPDGYVPGRNLWLHATAHLVARTHGLDRIWAGHTQEDSEEFPDARREYLEAVHALGDADHEPADAVRLELPLYEKTKAAILDEVRLEGVPLELTWSCYRDTDEPCGRCTSCRERDEHQ